MLVTKRGDPVTWLLTTFSMFTLDTIYLLISSVVSMVLGLLVFRWGLNRAIRDGSTTSY